MKNNKRGKIDVQHHISPKGYVERLAQIGIDNSYGEPFPDWTPKMSLKYMNKLNIETAIMSISTPGVYFKDQFLFSLEISRWCNEHMAKVKKEYPGRFGGFAQIPLGYVEESIEELKYALDELKLDGVGLLTHYDGKYLGDEKYDEFFNELNKRKAVVYIHPTDPEGVYDPKLGIKNSLIEALFETTRNIANMIYTGLLVKYPDIKFILAHGGGMIPFIANNLAAIKSLKNEKSLDYEKIQNSINKNNSEELSLLKNLYYDSGLVSGAPALNTLFEFVGSSKIVFGTDFPFAAGISTIFTKNLDNHPLFTEEDHKKIDYENCLKLFPQLK